MPSRDLLDFEKQMAFYGAYHHDPINKAIHLVFIPMILWSGMVFLSYLPLGVVLAGVPLTAAYLLAAGYGAYYVMLEAAAGLLFAPVLLSFAFSTLKFRAAFGASALPLAAAAHVTAWIAQFVGHGVFEKRAPALFDNLVQALVLAPFFAWVEVLFALGFKPELSSRLDKRIAASVAAYKESRAKSE